MCFFHTTIGSVYIQVPKGRGFDTEDYAKDISWVCCESTPDMWRYSLV